MTREETIAFVASKSGRSCAELEKFSDRKLKQLKDEIEAKAVADAAHEGFYGSKDGER